jgi:haloalkane dehalogenase
MTRRSRTSTVLASAAVSALVFSACGSDAASPAVTGPAPAVSTAAPTTAPAVTDPPVTTSPETTVAATEPPAPVACDAELDILTTDAGVDFVRTPDTCFENLPDWDYEAKYVEIDGLRQAYVDEGPADGEPILLLHGQPSWSYLYRSMIPELVKGGHRVIAMDHIGMGRSDKPVDLEYHSFQNHVDRLDTFIEELKLDKLTVFAQDWGSVISMYLWSEKPETFDRFVLGNGGLPDQTEQGVLSDDPAVVKAQADSFAAQLASVPAQQPFFFDENGNSLQPAAAPGDSDAFTPWAAYANTYEDFKPSPMLEALTFGELTAEEKAAYDAPFPSRITMAGPRSFPTLLNQLSGLVDPAKEELKNYTQPFLSIIGQNEPGVDQGQYQWGKENIAGAQGQAHHVYRDASHFLQDDKGADIGARINQFIIDNPLS